MVTFSCTTGDNAKYEVLNQLSGNKSYMETDFGYCVFCRFRKHIAQLAHIFCMRKVRLCRGWLLPSHEGFVGQVGISTGSFCPWQCGKELADQAGCVPFLYQKGLELALKVLSVSAGLAMDQVSQYSFSTLAPTNNNNASSQLQSTILKLDCK